jgi:3-dehydroquinate synthase
MPTLRSLTVGTAPSYPVHVGPDALATCADLITGADALIVDERAYELYGSLVDRSGLSAHLLPQGERAKTLTELERALNFLCEQQLDRSSTVLVLGGGAATDLGGFAAALYLRGVSWIACPTTLLAMVDASVGGKTAVNLSSGKNLAGSFHQPVAVIADTQTLASLSDAEYASGLGEVLKTALIGGEGLLSFLESEAAKLLARDSEAIAEVVARCVETKARIVASDPHEVGPRKALNLGHTFAHAIEHAAGPGTIPHGLAVAAGCTLSLRASDQAGFLADIALPERFARLADALGVPSELATLRALSGAPLPPDELLAAMSHDKKARAGTPLFVLPIAPGELEFDAEIDAKALLD